MYTLRYPFKLAAGQEIAVAKESTHVGNLVYSLKKQDDFYVLTITELPSEQEAKKYINTVWAGFMWLLLHRNLSPNASLEAQEIAYAEDPYQAAANLSKGFGSKNNGPVDGWIDGSSPAVYPSSKNIRTVTLGQATISSTDQSGYVLKYLSEGVSFPKSTQVIQDRKLHVALDLYGAYFTEFTANAKFLTLVMALEALATGLKRPPLVVGLLDKWRTEVNELLKTVDASSDDAASLGALCRELLFRKEDSIRSQIRNIVMTTLQAQGAEDAEEAAKNAVKIYDLRSTLVHQGSIERQKLNTAISTARGIVQRVLLARFIEAASPNEINDVEQKHPADGE